MRAEVILALACLADGDYQRRVWLNHEVEPGEGLVQLSDVIHTLYDDTEVLPEPESCLGTVLVVGDEIDRLRELFKAIDPLLDTHAIGDIDLMISDEAWPLVKESAARGLFAMIRSGGWA